mgnify:FL=1
MVRLVENHTFLNGDSLKKRLFTVAPGTKTIKCGDSAFAFILTVQGGMGDAYGAYLVNGYGDGGIARYHIGAIHQGDGIGLSIGSEGSKTLILTNKASNLIMTCSIVMLMGNSVTI